MATTTGTPAAFPTAPYAGGMGWRVGLSIATTFGWVSFVVLYLAFWVGSFSPAQTIAIVLVSFFTFIAINGIAWASWGIRTGPHGHP